MKEEAEAEGAEETTAVKKETNDPAHRSREVERRASGERGEKRARSATSGHRPVKAGSPVLSFEKIKVSARICGTATKRTLSIS